MKTTKKKKVSVPPLKAPDLGVRETACICVWLDYCTQCFEKQLKLWRKIHRTHKDAATRGSLRYHEEGLKALRWARGHAEQVLVSRNSAAGMDATPAHLAGTVAALWAVNSE